MKLKYTTKNINKEIIGKVVNAIPRNFETHIYFKEYKIDSISSNGDVNLISDNDKVRITGEQLSNRVYILEDSKTKELLNPQKVIEIESESFWTGNIIKIQLKTETIIGEVEEIAKSNPFHESNLSIRVWCTYSSQGGKSYDGNIHCFTFDFLKRNNAIITVLK